MLTRNVYILYPAGYGGSFIKWAIESWDRDLSPLVTSSPVNSSDSLMYGGPGTSHIHPRVPTHQALQQHLAWVLFNRPADKKVYLINTGTILPDTGTLNPRFSTLDAISLLIQADPSGVFINIHDSFDADIRSYASINSVTKWPTFLQVQVALRSTYVEIAAVPVEDYSGSLVLRNFLFSNPGALWTNNPLSELEISHMLQGVRLWYEVRNRNQPHEVNPETYNFDISVDSKLWQLSCLDILSESFVADLRDFLMAHDILQPVENPPVIQVHGEYVEAQVNTQWFRDVSAWRQTGKVTSYLRSHAVIQSELMKNMPGVDLIPGWQQLSIDELNAKWRSM